MAKAEDQKNRSFVVISPSRNEAEFIKKTLDSMVAQTVRPTLWIIVDDGSTDATADIVKEYAAKHDWIRYLLKADSVKRNVGPGVVQAFNFGLDTVSLDDYAYLCKLDTDLILPEKYFQTLIERMEAEPRIGTCSGKPYYDNGAGEMVSEGCGDETSIGASKFYRTECFREIGGFVSQVMWDAIDCHSCRRLGWVVCSWDEPVLRFTHLRPMGSSQRGILTGRMRHGFGQYFMGSSALYFFASAAYRMMYRPYVIGGLAMAWGFIRSKLAGVKQLDDVELSKMIRRYQQRALLVGKKRAIEEIEDRYASVWYERRGLDSGTNVGTG